MAVHCYHILFWRIIPFMEGAEAHKDPYLLDHKKSAPGGLSTLRSTAAVVPAYAGDTERFAFGLKSTPCVLSAFDGPGVDNHPWADIISEAGMDYSPSSRYSLICFIHSVSSASKRSKNRTTFDVPGLSSLYSGSLNRSSHTIQILCLGDKEGNLRTGTYLLQC